MLYEHGNQLAWFTNFVGLMLQQITADLLVQFELKFYSFFFQLGGSSPAPPAGPMGGLGDLFSLSGGVGIPGGMYSAPKQVRQD